MKCWMQIKYCTEIYHTDVIWNIKMQCVWRPAVDYNKLLTASALCGHRRPVVTTDAVYILSFSYSSFPLKLYFHLLHWDRCNWLEILIFNLIFTALHGMQTRSYDEISVCLSVCPSVCLSVRLSNACIVTKRKKDMFRFLYQTKEHLS